jgi:exoribonuclease R
MYVPHTVHFCSGESTPIQRYTDVCVHRLLAAAIVLQSLPQQLSAFKLAPLRTTVQKRSLARGQIG